MPSQNPRWMKTAQDSTEAKVAEVRNVLLAMTNDTLDKFADSFDVEIPSVLRKKADRVEFLLTEMRHQGRLDDVQTDTEDEEPEE